jgi:CRISPR-associated protein Cmr4
MTTASSVLFLHTQTSLHPGSGRGIGSIDLPVQRERHTDWPLIPGSTIKGVLRDYCRLKVLEEHDNKDLVWADRDPALECVFGPSVKGTNAEEGRGSNPSDFAGALSITDARVLFFPVRSLCGLFAWVTCSAALDRFRRDKEMVSGKKNDAIPAISLENRESATVVSTELLLKPTPGGAEGSNMVLEEFGFSAKNEDQALKAFAIEMSDILDLGRFATHLAVIHDDMFTHFVKNATEINARNALDYETKTAKSGALFYVETLPPETVFYSLLIADQPKKKHSKDDRPEKPALENEQKVLEYVRSYLKPTNDLPTILQIGGEASTGKGICRAFLWGEDAL